MDAHLVARELEMTLLAKLLEGKYVDASSNISMPAAALLHLLQTYLGPEVTMNDLQVAAKTSELLNWTDYAREIEVAGIHSDKGIRLTVFRWNKYASTSEPFRQILAQHENRSRPPIAATTYRGGPLGLNEVSFEIRNEGYGTQADVVISGITHPDWVAASHHGNKVTLSACPALGGVYRGAVVIATNVNDVTLQVSTESAAFTLPPRNELTLEELIPQHPDIDQSGTEHLLEKFLKQLKFERLPGGLFIKHGASAAQERSNDWWLTGTEILTGCLAGLGYPDKFTVYADADGKTDKYSEEVTAEHGQLGGGLADLFEFLDVQVGQRLNLSPYKGGYKMALSPAEPWRTARGHTFWVQGPTSAVLENPEVLESLLQRADDKNITVNLLLSGAQELPEDLVRQHRAGRLTIRFAAQPLPYKLIVCDEDCAAYVPPFGPMQRPATPPHALWESSTALEGRDYRNLAWQRGKRGEGSDEWGLLDLELSVAMEKLAKALRPPSPAQVEINEVQRRRLLIELPRYAAQLGVQNKPVLAAPILERYGVTAELVNACAYGVRVTAGGYLTVRPQSFSGQRELARYIGNLYGGVIHHSQLRKLVEAFTGHGVESSSFVMASLHDMGWGGNGYRRPRQAWEPQARELTPFTAEVLAHFETRQEALSWLRRNVAATEGQLERAIIKAAPLVAGYIARKAPKLPIIPADQTPGPTVTSPALSKAPMPPMTVKVKPPVKAAPVKCEVKFAPLPVASVTLPDPRFTPAGIVEAAVMGLIEREGPVTETWLLRRYAVLSRCNVRQVQVAVLEAANTVVRRGEVQRLAFPCGHVEYLIPGQQALLRERGSRNAEDISFGEWCELLHVLGLTSSDCDEARAHREATQAYKFGSDARRVLPLVGLALTTARRHS